MTETEFKLYKICNILDNNFDDESYEKKFNFKNEQYRLNISFLMKNLIHISFKKNKEIISTMYFYNNKQEIFRVSKSLMKKYDSFEDLFNKLYIKEKFINELLDDVILEII